MSTWIYLECASHTPPLRSEWEVGQHLTDLRKVFEVLEHREALVSPHIMGADFFAQRTIDFVRAHPRCDIRVIDECGRYHEKGTSGE